MENRSFEINLIAAMSENRCIGKNGTIPFYNAEDMKRFKEITTGNVVVMGSNTFKSLPKGKLPNRINVVITRDEGFISTLKNDKEILVADSVENAIKLYNSWFYHQKGLKECKKLFIIGGGMIYDYCIQNGLADRIYLTTIKEVVENGDTFFPTLDENKWKLVSREETNGVLFDVLEINKR